MQESEHARFCIVYPRDSFVNLGTPTTVHWATLLDKIQYAQDSNDILAGIVCDLLKAFFCLNSAGHFDVGTKRWNSF